MPFFYTRPLDLEVGFDCLHVSIMNFEHGEIIIYETENGRVEVRLEAETVWLTQRQMAQLFDTTSDNISLHLKNIYGAGELDRSATAEDFSAVQKEGDRSVRRNLKHYNLDAIISVLSLAISIKPSVVRIFIQAWKQRRPIFFTL